MDLWLRKFIIFLINTKKKHQVHVSLWLRKFIILFFDILGSSTRCTKSMWVVVFFLIYEDPIDASSLGLHNHCQWQLIPPTCCVNYFAFSSYIDMESHVCWTIDLILWNTKISSSTFFMEWSDFPVASSSTCTSFSS